MLYAEPSLSLSADRAVTLPDSGSGEFCQKRLSMLRSEALEMKILLICATALLFPVIILWSLTQPVAEMSPEWELAVVNAGKQLPSDHPTVGEFRSLLERLEERCLNPRQEIVEICITAHLWRKERGDLDTLLEFVQSIDEAIPQKLDFELDLQTIVRAMLNN